MISDLLKAEVNAEQQSEVIITLMTLTHPTLADPLRICNAGEALIHQGEEYDALAFTLRPPDQIDGQLPSLQFTGDNRDRRLSVVLRRSVSVAGYVGVSAALIFASDPDTVQYQYPALQLRLGEYSGDVVSASLTVEPKMEQRTCGTLYTRATTPGAFI